MSKKVNEMVVSSSTYWDWRRWSEPISFNRGWRPIEVRKEDEVSPNKLFKTI